MIGSRDVAGNRWVEESETNLSLETFVLFVSVQIAAGTAFGPVFREGTPSHATAIH